MVCWTVAEFRLLPTFIHLIAATKYNKYVEASALSVIVQGKARLHQHSVHKADLNPLFQGDAVYSIAEAQTKRALEGLFVCGGLESLLAGGHCPHTGVEAARHQTCGDAREDDHRDSRHHKASESNTDEDGSDRCETRRNAYSLERLNQTDGEWHKGKHLLGCE